MHLLSTTAMPIQEMQASEVGLRALTWSAVQAVAWDAAGRRETAPHVDYTCQYCKAAIASGLQELEGALGARAWVLEFVPSLASQPPLPPEQPLS